jgi:hypothetical protein
MASVVSLLIVVIFLGKAPSKSEWKNYAIFW